MQDVLNKVDELIGTLEDKIKVNEALNQRLGKQKQELEEKEKNVIARLNHASAMERVYKKYDDFDKEQKAFAAKQKELNERIKKAQEQEDNDAKILAQIEDENKKLDARKIALNKQGDVLKKKEIELEEAKSQLKSFMNGESLKGLLK